MTMLKNKKSGFDIIGIIKSLGALAVIIPLVLGFLQYKQSVQENQDKNFREIVALLSSDKKQERLASATNLGTFIKEGNPYNQEAIDILINMVSIESDIDVIQSIRGSLEKIVPTDYKIVIEKLLKIERNHFIYNNYLSKRLRARIDENNEESSKIKEFEKTGIKPKQKDYQPQSAADRLLYESYQLRFKESLQEERDLDNQIDNQPFLQELITKFIISFSQQKPVEGLELYQNSWISVALTDVKLPKIIIKRSVISSATIINTDFNHSLIENSELSYSEITNTDFSGSTINASLLKNITTLKNTTFQGTAFKDVFFTHTNVAGADFTGATGLHPMNFYKAINLDQAIFDKEFAKQLNTVNSISDDEFRAYVQKTTLTQFDIQVIFKDLDSVNKGIDG